MTLWRNIIKAVEKFPLQESLTVEFKREWAESAKDSLCAFANTSGGTIYFVIEDNGDVVWLEDPDEVVRAVNSVLRFAMHPAVDTICRTATLSVEPEIECLPRMLQIVLPRIAQHLTDLSDRERQVVSFLRASGGQSRPAIQNELRKSYGTTLAVLQPLMAKRAIERVGSGRDTVYRLK